MAAEFSLNSFLLINEFMIDCRYQSEMKLNESKIESTGINNWRKKDLLE